MSIKSHIQKIVSSLSSLQAEIFADLERKRFHASQEHARSNILLSLLALIEDESSDGYLHRTHAETYHFRLNNLDVLLERFWGNGDSLHFCKDGICVAHWTDGANRLMTGLQSGEELINQSDAFLPADVEYFLSNLDDNALNIFEFHITPWASGAEEPQLGTIIFHDQYENTSPGRSDIFKHFPHLARQKLSDDLGL